jgi:hypothetical protein
LNNHSNNWKRDLIRCIDHEKCLPLRNARHVDCGYIRIQFSGIQDTVTENTAITRRTSTNMTRADIADVQHAPLLSVHQALKERSAVGRVSFCSFGSFHLYEKFWQLQALGFSHEVAFRAYLVCDCDEDMAANGLLEGIFNSESE